jgi:hypothetical protein
MTYNRKVMLHTLLVETGRAIKRASHIEDRAERDAALAMTIVALRLALANVEVTPERESDRDLAFWITQVLDDLHNPANVRFVKGSGYAEWVRLNLDND